MNSKSVSRNGSDASIAASYDTTQSAEPQKTKRRRSWSDRTIEAWGKVADNMTGKVAGMLRLGRSRSSSGQEQLHGQELFRYSKTATKAEVYEHLRREFLYKEKAYYETLVALHKKFELAVEREAQPKLAEIFVMIKSLETVSKDLLQFTKDGDYCNKFIDNADLFTTYSEYIEKHLAFITTTNEFQKASPALQLELADAETELYKPMQRLVEYRNHFRRLIREFDSNDRTHVSLKPVLNQLVDMVGKLYTIHGEKDDFQRIVALEDGIHSSDCGVLGSDNEKMNITLNLTAPIKTSQPIPKTCAIHGTYTFSEITREVVRKFRSKHYNQVEKPIKLTLLTDCVLVTREKKARLSKKPAHDVLILPPIRLEDIVIHDRQTEQGEKDIFELRIQKQTLMVFKAPSAEAKREWINNLTERVKDLSILRGEKDTSKNMVQKQVSYVVDGEKLGQVNVEIDPEQKRINKARREAAKKAREAEAPKLDTIFSEDYTVAYKYKSEENSWMNLGPASVRVFMVSKNKGCVDIMMESTGKLLCSGYVKADTVSEKPQTKRVRLALTNTVSTSSGSKKECFLIGFESPALADKFKKTIDDLIESYIRGMFDECRQDLLLRAPVTTDAVTSLMSKTCRSMILHKHDAEHAEKAFEYAGPVFMKLDHHEATDRYRFMISSTLVNLTFVDTWINKDTTITTANNTPNIVTFKFLAKDKVYHYDIETKEVEAIVATLEPIRQKAWDAQITDSDEDVLLPMVEEEIEEEEEEEMEDAENASNFTTPAEEKSLSAASSTSFDGKSFIAQSTGFKSPTQIRASMGVVGAVPVLSPFVNKMSAKQDDDEDFANVMEQAAMRDIVIDGRMNKKQTMMNRPVDSATELVQPTVTVMQAVVPEAQVNVSELLNAKNEKQAAMASAEFKDSKFDVLDDMKQAAVEVVPEPRSMIEVLSPVVVKDVVKVLEQQMIRKLEAQNMEKEVVVEVIEEEEEEEVEEIIVVEDIDLTVRPEHAKISAEEDNILTSIPMDSTSTDIVTEIENETELLSECTITPQTSHHGFSAKNDEAELDTATIMTIGDVRQRETRPMSPALDINMAELPIRAKSSMGFISTGLRSLSPIPRSNSGDLDTLIDLYRQTDITETDNSKPSASLPPTSRRRVSLAPPAAHSMTNKPATTSSQRSVSYSFGSRTKPFGAAFVTPELNLSRTNSFPEETEHPHQPTKYLPQDPSSHPSALDHIMSKMEAIRPRATTAAPVLTRNDAAAGENFRALMCEMEELRKQLEFLKRENETLKCRGEPISQVIQRMDH